MDDLHRRSDEIRPRNTLIFLPLKATSALRVDQKSRRSGNCSKAADLRRELCHNVYRSFLNDDDRWSRSISLRLPSLISPSKSWTRKRWRRRLGGGGKRKEWEETKHRKNHVSHSMWPKKFPCRAEKESKGPTESEKIFFTSRAPFHDSSKRSPYDNSTHIYARYDCHLARLCLRVERNFRFESALPNRSLKPHAQEAIM